jgi:hypothetical protein
MLVTLALKNANDAMVVPMVGSGRAFIWQDTGIWSQAVGFVLMRLAGIWLQSL